ncbi:PaaI family thioesterase [Bacteroidota bacterium]
MLLKELNKFCKNSLIDHLGMEFISAGKGQVKVKMPVDNRTIQPLGILHGGSIMALAETAGSAGSFLLVDREIYDVFGIEINGNHIANTKTKYVIAVADIVHEGKNTHVWNVNVYNADKKLISVCRITNMIIDKKLKRK